MKNRLAVMSIVCVFVLLLGLGVCHADDCDISQEQKFSVLHTIGIISNADNLDDFVTRREAFEIAHLMRGSEKLDMLPSSTSMESVFSHSFSDVDNFSPYDMSLLLTLGEEGLLDGRIDESGNYFADFDTLITSSEARLLLGKVKQINSGYVEECTQTDDEEYISKRDFYSEVYDAMHEFATWFGCYGGDWSWYLIDGAIN